MYNKTGIKSMGVGNSTQILANVEMQASVGCVVPQTLGVDVGTSKIAKAGTPIAVDFMNLNNPVVAGGGANATNAYLLHDVDVTNGNNNGTALYFGTININRVEDDVKTKIEAVYDLLETTKMVTIVKA